MNLHFIQRLDSNLTGNTDLLPLERTSAVRGHNSCLFLTTRRKVKINCTSKMQLHSFKTGCVCTTNLENVTADRLYNKVSVD